MSYNNDNPSGQRVGGKFGGNTCGNDRPVEDIITDQGSVAVASYRPKAKSNGRFDFSRSDFFPLELEEVGALFSLLLDEASIGKDIVGSERYFSSLLMTSARKWRRISATLQKEGFISIEEVGHGRCRIAFNFESPFLAAKLLKIFKRQAIPHDLRSAVYERDRNACVECGSETHLTCDHIIPVTSGGETSLENLQTLCLPCNASKGARNGGAS